MRAERLTSVAQRWHAEALHDGALALDGTLGNGHDAVFLAEHVGPAGRLFGFDCQQAALAATTARLQAAGLRQRATLFLAGHQRLLELLPDAVPGRLDAAMFNLGYLPGGDKAIVTAAETTCQALQQVWRALRPGGRLSVLVYVGHAGGDRECTAVEDWLERLAPPAGHCRRVTARAARAPRLLLLTR